MVHPAESVSATTPLSCSTSAKGAWPRPFVWVLQIALLPASNRHRLPSLPSASLYGADWQTNKLNRRQDESMNKGNQSHLLRGELRENVVLLGGV